ncbi:MAG TPA: WYL domain-containing protein [Gemmatimonadales bacterium]|nr:WYL domain-containing protein [Gemmatimonadales bacterium]
MAGSKLQRWMDLLAALLRRHYPVTFDEVRQDVPAYTSGAPESVRRKFERDKDDLRQFGVPIETVTENGEVLGYRLRTRDFYMPYLAVVDAERRTEPQRVNRDGFRALERLAFTSDELAAIADGARQVLHLDDDDLTSDVRSALRKLAVDLPMDGVEQASNSVSVLSATARHDHAVLDELAGAMERRKLVSFDYASVAMGTTTHRTVEPLGLFFLSHHWYLAAREPGEALVKNFRVSRMRNAHGSRRKPGTPDFERPVGFDLRQHARQRNAWELGDGNWMDAVVSFNSHSGIADAAQRLGAEVPGAPSERRYQVRRLDAFVRWLLPLAGQVTPVSPPELVEAWQDALHDTLALYGGSA